MSNLRFECVLCSYRTHIAWPSSVSVQHSLEWSCPRSLKYVGHTQHQLLPVLCEFCIAKLREHEQPTKTGIPVAMTIKTKFTIMPGALHVTVCYGNGKQVVVSAKIDYDILYLQLPLDLEPKKAAELHVLLSHRGKVWTFSRRFIWEEGFSAIGTNGYPVLARFAEFKPLSKRSWIRGIGDAEKRMVTKTEPLADIWDGHCSEFVLVRVPDPLRRTYIYTDPWIWGKLDPRWGIVEFGLTSIEDHKLRGSKWFTRESLLTRWWKVRTLEKVLERNWDAIQRKLWAPEGLMAARGWREIETLLH